MRQTIYAELGYLEPTSEKPVYFAAQPGADAELKIAARIKSHTVAIADARGMQPAPTLDSQGFALAQHRSAVTDFYDDDQIGNRYEDEVIALVKQATGAAHAVVFDHTRRSDRAAIRGARNTREPSAVVHNDYTDASAEKRVRDILHDDADECLKRRFAIINVWRSIAGPVFTTPLALCDASSTRPADLVATERRAKDRIGELELVTWNPAHRWYWFSGMTRDEAMLIKTYDSDKSGRARRSIHTAFINPEAPADATPRESMETRTLVFFD